MKEGPRSPDELDAKLVGRPDRAMERHRVHVEVAVQEIGDGDRGPLADPDDADLLRADDGDWRLTEPVTQRDGRQEARAAAAEYDDAPHRPHERHSTGSDSLPSGARRNSSRSNGVNGRGRNGRRADGCGADPVTSREFVEQHRGPMRGTSLCGTAPRVRLITRDLVS